MPGNNKGSRFPGDGGEDASKMTKKEFWASRADNIAVGLTEKFTREVDVSGEIEEGYAVTRNGDVVARQTPWNHDGDEPANASTVCEVEDIQKWGKKNLAGFLESHREWRRKDQGSSRRPPKRRSTHAPLELPPQAKAFVDCLKFRSQCPCPPSADEDPCSVTALMDKVAAQAIEDIRTMLVCQGASTYGLPQDESDKYIQFLDIEIWCERSKVALELKLLRQMLECEQAEADATLELAEAGYAATCPGSTAYINGLSREFKKMEHCLKPIRDQRAKMHRQAKALCRTINDATAVMYHPLDYAVRALLNKRGGESPMEAMWSSFTTDLIHAAKFILGYNNPITQCRTFTVELGRLASDTLRSATWAGTALCEYLQIRGPHFPEYPPRDSAAMGERGDEDVPPEKILMFAEGPAPPRKPTSYEKWALQRDAYILQQEADYFRQLIRSHGYSSKEASKAVPAFPVKDKERIWKGRVSLDYFNDQAGTWRSRWVVKHALTQNRLEYVKPEVQC